MAEKVKTSIYKILQYLDDSRVFTIFTKVPINTFSQKGTTRGHQNIFFEV